VRAGLEGSFFSQPTTGSGQYVRGLWREFTREGAAPGLEPVLLRPGPVGADEEEPGGGELVVEEAPRRLARLAGPRVRKVWWELRGLPRAARRTGVELVHVPYFAALPRPGRPPVPYVVTIHDLVPLVLPVYTRSRAMRLYLRLARFTARRATLILTDSQHSANDIVRHLAVPRERLRVVPLAADEFFRPLPPDDPAIAAARDKYGLDGPFIFNVGGLDTRKNLGALIRGFALARSQLPAGMRLVIGGAAHTGNPEVYPDLGPVVAEAGVGPWVVFPGRISDEEKLALLNAADLYVFPSLYEGFGIPPLEAMRCGTPVVCSDRSSLPEVVGDGGLLVEPTPEKLGAAIAFALCTPHERQELRRRALAQAARFSWARTAEATLKVYREALDMVRGKQGRSGRQG
jgi:glycosyltransferase involved in cell wall biosynthesis